MSEIRGLGTRAAPLSNIDAMHRFSSQLGSNDSKEVLVVINSCIERLACVSSCSSVEQCQIRAVCNTLAALAVQIEGPAANT